jgi:hypothetical protein
MSASASAEGWVCAADYGVGYQYTDATGRWTPGTFNVTDKKYVITKAAAEDLQYRSDARWVIKRVGEQDAISYCGALGKPEEGGWLFCEGLDEFTFRSTSSRFTHIHQGLLNSSPDEIKEMRKALRMKDGQPLPSPVMLIGRCTAL